ncbi:alpha/beta fold hydrolase [Pseudonocardiaceae bacterium YIM PH 21723]|nr:alpha/beta fold hydrolase [Pseudonocardiaceae bacterium YIM PH 21723]
MRRTLLVLGAVAAVVTAAVTVPDISFSGVAATDGLDWQPCHKVAKGWYEADTRSECVLVPVPLDYAKPDGRKIGIAVSRARATGTRTGVLFTNPGGPGLNGVQVTHAWLHSRLGELNDQLDVIGIDTRGVGYSDRVSCAGIPHDPLPPNPTAEQVYDNAGAWNQRCFARDPELFAALTIENVARDMDTVRRLLGEEKINYYGNSGGTIVGAMYRSMFDEHVARMWIESVMAPVSDITARAGVAEADERNFHDFSAWAAQRDAKYHFGATAQQVESALTGLRDRFGYEVVSMATTFLPRWPLVAAQLAELRDSGQPAALAPAGRTTYGWADQGNSYAETNTAFMCNAIADEREYADVLRNRAELAKRFPFSGGFTSGLDRCEKWPVPGRVWDLKPGKSELQLSAHEFDGPTPYPWAKLMQTRIGGNLLTVPDGSHSSIKVNQGQCGTQLVEFFRTGTPATGTCPGESMESEGEPGNLAGTLSLNGCSGSIVRPTAAKDEDKALLLTNGHCAPGDRPKPGQVLTNQQTEILAEVRSPAGRGLGFITAPKVLYATMTGTDVLLAQLPLSYAEIEQKYKVKALPLADRGPAEGQPITVASGGLTRSWECQAEAVVPLLREGGYEVKQAIRYAKECDTGPGSSGSPVLDARTRAVVAINSTSNRDGKQCAADNPCEVDSSGVVSVHQGRGYATQITAINGCVGAGNVLDLNREGCRLLKP